MALTLQEVEKAEEQARLQRRMALATNAENNANNRSADLNQAAHDRFMQRRRNFLERNPNAVSPGEYAATMGFERGKDPTGLRKHELDVLKQQGDNDFRVAEQKRFGMREQGSDAAGLNAEATKYGWDQQLEMEKNRQNGLTEREKMIGERTERIAGMEHGTVGPDGNVIPGSRERVATIQAETAAQQAELQRQHEIEKQTIIKDGNENVAAIKGAATAARREHQDAMREQKDFENWINTVNDFRNTTLTEQEKTALRQMTPEEQKAYWMKKTGRTPSGTQGAPAKRSWRDRYQPAQ